MRFGLIRFNVSILLSWQTGEVVLLTPGKGERKGKDEQKERDRPEARPEAEPLDTTGPQLEGGCERKPDTIGVAGQ